MTQNKIVIKEDLKYNELEELLEGVKVGDLIGVHQNVPPYSHYLIGSYTHITSSDTDSPNNGLYLHCKDLLDVHFPKSSREVPWGNIKITLKFQPISFSVIDSGTINLKSDEPTNQLSHILIGRETISASLEDEGLYQFSGYIKNYKPSN